MYYIVHLLMHYCTVIVHFIQNGIELNFLYYFVHNSYSCHIKLHSHQQIHSPHDICLIIAIYLMFYIICFETCTRYRLVKDLRFDSRSLLSITLFCIIFVIKGFLTDYKLLFDTEFKSENRFAQSALVLFLFNFLFFVEISEIS